jgi:hypothetical protein
MEQPDPPQSGTASRETGSGTAGPVAKADYRNYHQSVDVSATEGPLTTAPYKNIQTQRKLHGEHTATGSGPAADTFSYGDIFLNGDNRNNITVVVEDNRVLLVSTNSFQPDDWTCVSCERKHQLLPTQRDRNRWDGGRQLIFLCDNNMPLILPPKDRKCPVILRVEGGLLREIGTYFLDRLQGFAVPEGSVIVTGSVTHLMEEGQVGYTKALVTETIRFTKCFKGNVHVVPFLPPPLGETNDPELIQSMLDILFWMEKLQKWDLSS